MFATDTGGTKVWETSYLPFGGVQTSTGPNSELRFPGQWFQSETGLHQNWMRDYDPTLGRYLQADPLGLVDGASVYGYVLQNPGRHVDPRGLYTLQDARNSLNARLGYLPRRWADWSDDQVFDEWLRLERADQLWQAGLPECPCTVEFGNDYSGETWRGLNAMGRAENSYHPGNNLFSMRSQSNDFGSGVQCVYSRDGRLVLPGQHREVVRGNMQDRAGTIDRYSSDVTDPIGILKHRSHDVAPYNLAGKLNRLDDYFTVRPLFPN